VEAFTWLENHNGFTVEGIFRKDGNATRIRNPWVSYRTYFAQNHMPKLPKIILIFTANILWPFENPG
jgi:hypothetical protein